MTRTTTGRNGSLSEVRKRFRQVIARVDSSIPPPLSRAVKSLLTALEYEDRPLIRSHLETTMTALVEAIADELRRGVALSRELRTHYEEVASEYGVAPSEESDEIGRFVESQLNNMLRGLTEARDDLVRQPSVGGHLIPGGADLVAEIEQLEAFKTSLIGGWPWSALPTPIPDPEVTARSHAEAARGELLGADALFNELGADEPGGR